MTDFAFQETTMAMSFDKSAARVKAASRHIPGGVNSNFRAGISPTPLVVQKGEGAHLIDADGNRLIDYYLGMGAILLGHNPKPVVDAIRAQLEHGILYAAQCEIEYEAAELFCKLIPCAERVRFNSSGSEVVQAVFRLARAATGRPTIVKFEGHYHGWFDNIAWSTAPGPSEFGNEDDPAHVSGTPGMARDWTRALTSSCGMTSNGCASGSSSAMSRPSSWNRPCATRVRSTRPRATSRACANCVTRPARS